MSAETLREAAKVLRERAEAATPGPWAADQRGGVTGRFAGMTEVISESTDQSHADFIATMHPGVALALADVFERVANRADQIEGTMASPKIAASVIAGSVPGWDEASYAADLILGGAR